jgi:2,3-bisphosphoglycerate-dependent phosphoglycerate mutase
LSRGASNALVLIRHARTVLTDGDVFTGWIDVPLSPAGQAEAARCAERIAEEGPHPEIIFTSTLSRSIETAEVIASRLGQPAPAVVSTWRLNERNYGSAQGRRRSEVQAQLGATAYARMHRSWEGAAAAGSGQPTGYDVLDPTPYAVTSESLSDVSARVRAVLQQRIIPELRAGRQVMIVSHSNTLRAVVALIEGVPPIDVDRIEVPIADPRAYPAAAVFAAIEGSTRTGAEPC